MNIKKRIRRMLHSIVFIAVGVFLGSGFLLWLFQSRLVFMPNVGGREHVETPQDLGLPYEEVAAALDRPVGTVKADVHRGLARLRTRLQEGTP